MGSASSCVCVCVCVRACAWSKMKSVGLKKYIYGVKLPLHILAVIKINAKFKGEIWKSIYYTWKNKKVGVF